MYERERKEAYIKNSITTKNNILILNLCQGSIYYDVLLLLLLLLFKIKVKKQTTTKIGRGGVEMEELIHFFLYPEMREL